VPSATSSLFSIHMVHMAGLLSSLTDKSTSWPVAP
jgi:hypothetical protein